MTTVDELIDILANISLQSNLFCQVAEINMELTAEWIRFLSVGGKVKTDCLIEPLDFYSLFKKTKTFEDRCRDDIWALSAFHLIQKEVKPENVIFVDREEIGFLTDIEEIAELRDLSKMWVHWKNLTGEIIPEGYDMRDAAESVDIFDPQKVGSYELDLYIRSRIKYLSDRLDPARAWDLDNSIRFALGLNPRNADDLL